MWILSYSLQKKYFPRIGIQVQRTKNWSVLEFPVLYYVIQRVLLMVETNVVKHWTVHGSTYQHSATNIVPELFCYFFLLARCDLNKVVTQGELISLNGHLVDSKLWKSQTKSVSKDKFRKVRKCPKIKVCFKFTVLFIWISPGKGQSKLEKKNVGSFWNILKKYTNTKVRWKIFKSCYGFWSYC